MFNITSTVDNINVGVSLQTVAAGLCTVLLCISAVSTNYDLTENVCVDDVNSVVLSDNGSNAYNSGIIEVSYGGDATINYELLNNFKRLIEIEELPQNWNGNRANIFSKTLISTVRRFVESAIVQPNIFPTARDSIQVEYENNRGDYLEFEFFETGRIKKFYYSSDNISETKDILFDELNGEIISFYGREI